MTKRTEKFNVLHHLIRIGISSDHATALRRIALRLHRWHELECGVENGGVERDETTGKCFWYNSYTGKRSPHRDDETPALKRLEKIKAQYPGYMFFIQGDPRGAALHVLGPDHVAPLYEIAAREYGWTIRPATVDQHGNKSDPCVVRGTTAADPEHSFGFKYAENWKDACAADKLALPLDAYYSRGVAIY